MADQFSPSQQSRRRFLGGLGLAVAGATMPRARAERGDALPTKVNDLTRCPSHPLDFAVVNGLPLGSPATEDGSYPTAYIEKSADPKHLVVGMQLAVSFLRDSNGAKVDAEFILERNSSFRLTDSRPSDYIAQPREVQQENRDGKEYRVSGPGLTYEKVGADTLPIATHRIVDGGKTPARTSIHEGHERDIYFVEYLFPNELCIAVAAAEHPLINPVFQHVEQENGWGVIALAQNKGNLPAPLISGYDQRHKFINRQVLWNQKLDNLQGGYSIIPVTVELPVPASPVQRISTTKGNIAISFASQEHVSYQIETSESMVPDSWRPLGPPISGDGKEIMTNHVPTSNAMHYRIQAELDVNSYMKVLDA